MTLSTAASPDICSGSDGKGGPRFLVHTSLSPSPSQPRPPAAPVMLSWSPGTKPLSRCSSLSPSQLHASALPRPRSCEADVVQDVPTMSVLQISLRGEGIAAMRNVSLAPTSWLLSRREMRFLGTEQTSPGFACTSPPTAWDEGGRGELTGSGGVSRFPKRGARPPCHARLQPRVPAALAGAGAARGGWRWLARRCQRWPLRGLCRSQQPPAIRDHQSLK